MRDLQKNTVVIWYTSPSAKAEVMDGLLHTGEYATTFATPIKARISMYPANTSITEELFGKDASIDMVASSTKIILSQDTLIFLTQPVSNYAKTYDYSISAISPSLNVKTYGLKKRV